MITAIRQLDRILRGDATRPDTLRDQGIRFPIFGLIALLILLGAVYGVCMGIYALAGEAGSGDKKQIVASAVKVPLLFFLTLVVTMPSLYVFNALLGSRLTFGPLVRLMLGSLGVTMAVLSSIGPIVAFFSVSTTSYPFMVLLNVLVFAISGFLGLTFLKQTLNRLILANLPPPSMPTRPAPMSVIDDEGRVVPQEPAVALPPPLPVGALDIAEESTLGHHTRKVFTIWMLVFGLVGSQMAWILRPWLGAPGKEFTWFRPRGSNFFEAVWNLIRDLMGLV